MIRAQAFARVRRSTVETMLRSLRLRLAGELEVRAFRAKYPPDTTRLSVTVRRGRSAGFSAVSRTSQ